MNARPCELSTWSPHTPHVVAPQQQTPAARPGRHARDRSPPLPPATPTHLVAGRLVHEGRAYAAHIVRERLILGVQEHAVPTAVLHACRRQRDPVVRRWQPVLLLLAASRPRGTCYAATRAPTVQGEGVVVGLSVPGLARARPQEHLQGHCRCSAGGGAQAGLHHPARCRLECGVLADGGIEGFRVVPPDSRAAEAQAGRPSTAGADALGHQVSVQPGPGSQGDAARGGGPAGRQVLPLEECVEERAVCHPPLQHAATFKVLPQAGAAAAPGHHRGAWRHGA